ncbi:NAD(P)H-hydrate dehydratase [Occallatibacter savannae]|uniref:NAD(P)H-hydrate dehydratase n=1 Tax=Occallatibacter savannae TaxID=1002691 RepID=UPI000D68F328|nr:NAD(P)H-hydrate dehydratase [Occallatibacter savannae]
MKVLSAAEMQACDRVTTERAGVPSIELMRNAAAAVDVFAREQYPKARRVTVLCGKGNNGGDGMMAARLLAKAGLEVTTLLLGSQYELKGDAAVAWRELSVSPNRYISEVNTATELRNHNAALETDLIIDAVVGTGFKPPIRGLAEAALEWVSASKAPFLSIDLPSGWPADATASQVETKTFPSDAVITFTAPKPAHVFGELTRRWDQPVVVAAIGSPDEAIVSKEQIEWAGGAHSLLERPRAADANKGKYGHVLVIGGSTGKSGAPAMSAMAAMRAGAGLVTAAVPSSIAAQVAAFAPELMTHPMMASPAGELASSGITAQQFEKLIEKITVIAVGPGLGQGPGVEILLEAALSDTKLPLVIDADGLNTLAANPPLMEKLAESGKSGRTIVLTPHPGEMARLAQKIVAEVQANRLETARIFARDNGVTLVLKGSRTLIAHPDGRVAVNTSGNPGMAKGGSGDVLTGIVAGMLAQFSGEAASAVEAAVYLHGLAADIAVRDADEHTVLATDSFQYFPEAFRFRANRFCKNGQRGYVWLQGLPERRSAETAG